MPVITSSEGPTPVRQIAHRTTGVFVRNPDAGGLSGATALGIARAPFGRCPFEVPRGAPLAFRWSTHRTWYQSPCWRVTRSPSRIDAWHRKHWGTWSVRCSTTR